jgi:hypothetical protein
MARVNAGQAGIWHDGGPGKGKIYCDKAPTRGIQERLLNQTIAMVDELGFSIVIFSVDTGKHAPRSRHYTGRAEDITDVHVYGQDPYPATMANPHAMRMVEWFVHHGHMAGRENGPYDAVLFGPCGQALNRTRSPHVHHAHVSIFKP